MCIVRQCERRLCRWWVGGHQRNEIGSSSSLAGRAGHHWIAIVFIVQGCPGLGAWSRAAKRSRVLMKGTLHWRGDRKLSEGCDVSEAHRGFTGTGVSFCAGWIFFLSTSEVAAGLVLGVGAVWGSVYKVATGLVLCVGANCGQDYAAAPPDRIAYTTPLRQFLSWGTPS